MNDVTYRISFGLEAVFVSNKAFILVTTDERLAIRIEDSDFLNKTKASFDMPELLLNDKKLEHWYLVPRSFNKKKNKLIPFINSAHTALFNKRKKKNKKIKKQESKKISISHKRPIKEKKLTLIEKILGWF